MTHLADIGATSAPACGARGEPATFAAEAVTCERCRHMVIWTHRPRKQTHGGHCTCQRCMALRPAALTELALEAAQDLKARGRGRLEFVCADCRRPAWIVWDDLGPRCLECGSRSGQVRHREAPVRSSLCS